MQSSPQSELCSVLTLLIVCLTFTIEEEVFMETVAGISCETQ